MRVMFHLGHVIDRRDRQICICQYFQPFGPGSAEKIGDDNSRSAS